MIEIFKENRKKFWFNVRPSRDLGQLYATQYFLELRSLFATVACDHFYQHQSASHPPIVILEGTLLNALIERSAVLDMF
jgi:hypothetical protein